MEIGCNKIETIIDWILTERCNLNCYYCLQHADTRKAKCTPIDSHFIEKVESPVLFHLTGGEPFLVPNLIELINQIQTTGHYVSLNTNLTHTTKTFSEKVNKEKFLFVNASYHYIYRKENISPFVRNYMHMRESGIFVYATIVMIPQMIDVLSVIADKLADQGVCVLPKLMRGVDKGKLYPRDYDSKQLEIISSILKKTKAKLSEDEKKRFRRACLLNVSIDDWQAENQVIGTRCFDGMRFIRITETGDVVICNGIILGNVYKDDFEFQFNEVKKDCPYKTSNFLCKMNY